MELSPSKVKRKAKPKKNLLLRSQAKNDAELDLVTKLAEDVEGVNNVVNKMIIK